MQTFLERDSAVNRDIYYIKVCGVYGHTLVNIGAPSVSFSPNSIGFSFSGGLSTDNLGIKKYRLFIDGRKVAIDA